MNFGRMGMMTVDEMTAIGKDDLEQASKQLTGEDLAQLIDLLSVKEDRIRYQAFLLVQNRSKSFDDVYPFWNVFSQKLKSDNSYQRSIGVMLMAENTKWDKDNRLEQDIGSYLAILGGEKPITVRQCIQSLAKIIPYKPGLHEKIADALIGVELAKLPQTMQKLVLLDILNILMVLKKDVQKAEIDQFIFGALSGELLDKKSKKQIEAAL